MLAALLLTVVGIGIAFALWLMFVTYLFSYNRRLDPDEYPAVMPLSYKSGKPDIEGGAGT